MIIAALSAPQRRSPSPPPARRSRKPMASRGRQPSFQRRACATPTHPGDRTRSPASVPPAIPPAARHRRGPRKPSAILKSP